MSNRRLTTLSLLFALILIQTIVPGLGYIPWGPLSLTIIPVTVMIVSVILGTSMGTIIGGFWGLVVFIRAFFLPTSPLALVFMNPLIAILPRLLIGLVIGWLYNYLLKNRAKTWQLSLLGGLGSLINTIVLSALMLLFFGNASATIHQMSGKALVPFLQALFIGNGIPEMILDAILLPLIAKPLLRIIHRG